MAKAQASLEEGLNDSANKRGLSGTEKHRYIGGALHNMGKARTRSGKHEPVARTHTAQSSPEPRKAAPAPSRKQYEPSVKRGTAPAPGRTAITRRPGRTGIQSKPKPRERLTLTVKENTKASAGKPYKLYSIYKGKEQYSPDLFRKPANARAEAKIATDAYNQGYARKRIA